MFVCSQVTVQSEINKYTFLNDKIISKIWIYYRTQNWNILCMWGDKDWPTLEVKRQIHVKTTTATERKQEYDLIILTSFQSTNCCILQNKLVDVAFSVVPGICDRDSRNLMRFEFDIIFIFVLFWHKFETRIGTLTGDLMTVFWYLKKESTVATSMCLQTDGQTDRRIN